MVNRPRRVMVVGERAGMRSTEPAELSRLATVPACSSPSRPLRAGFGGAASRQPGLRLRACGERG
jgi:hypothetical protein